MAQMLRHAISLGIDRYIGHLFGFILLHWTSFCGLIVKELINENERNAEINARTAVGGRFEQNINDDFNHLNKFNSNQFNPKKILDVP